MLIDTHVHFDGVGGDLDGVVERARGAGVGRMLAVGGTPGGNDVAMQCARRFPGVIGAAVGYDRYTAGQDLSMERLRTLAADPAVVAIGEIGLDFHHQPETRPEQELLFEQMLALARDVARPVIVHVRESESSALTCLAGHVRAWSGRAEAIGVIHCFTGDAAFARAVLDLGFYISFSGILTFRNADPLREVARGVPADRLLLETDSPYLAPVPHRGRPNEPALLPAVAAVLATVRGSAVESIAETTSLNAERLFALPAG